MNSFKCLFVFALFSQIFLFQIFIICGEQNFRTKRLDTIDGDLTVDDMTAETSCSKEFRKKANALHRESLCKSPRKTLIEVKMPSKYYMPGIFQRPQMVEVERCDGVCQQANHMCLPVEKDYIDIHVTSDFLFRLDSIVGSLLSPNGRPTKGISQEKCMFVKIERHRRCRCMCVMTEQSCNDKQLFREDRCACECRNHNIGKTCNSINKMWDPNTCDCQCPPTASRECSTGAVFDEQTCRCIQNQEIKKLI